MKYHKLKIIFKENGDVHYYHNIFGNNDNNFKLKVDYPIDKIEILDDTSIYPIYISELPDEKSLIEIKELVEKINVNFIKKNFLKKLLINESKIHLKYSEEIEIKIGENSIFELSIHSPYSYISALKRKSFAYFKGINYTASDLYHMVFNQSGIIKIDWELEIIEEKKLNNINDIALPIKTTRQFEFSPRAYSINWLNKLNTESDIDDVYFTEKLKTINIEEIIIDSCFYLSAGSDITPIIALKNKIRSFVFCDSNRNFNEKLSKLEKRLSLQGFKKVISVKVDKQFLKISDIHFLNGYKCQMKNADISIWKHNNLFYSLLYINWDNSAAYNALYVKNKIIPKAICEILSEGGSLNIHSLVKIPYKYRMPKYAIGQTYSLGKVEEYELISENLQYFGDYENEYGGDKYGKKLWKKK